MEIKDFISQHWEEVDGNREMSIVTWMDELTDEQRESVLKACDRQEQWSLGSFVKLFTWYDFVRREVVLKGGGRIDPTGTWRA